MEYNVKLSKDTININSKDYDIPKEVAEFIIYEISTRDDLIQARDVYKRTIDKAIEYIKENIYSYYDSKGEKYIEETEFERNASPKELLDILKVVR